MWKNHSLIQLSEDVFLWRLIALSIRYSGVTDPLADGRDPPSGEFPETGSEPPGWSMTTNDLAIALIKYRAMNEVRIFPVRKFPWPCDRANSAVISSIEIPSCVTWRNISCTSFYSITRMNHLLYSTTSADRCVCCWYDVQASVSVVSCCWILDLLIACWNGQTTVRTETG